MIRPPTAKICLLSPSVWHVLCRFWKKKNSALSGTECLVIHLSYFLIYLWVIFVHMPTRIVSSQKGLRNGIVFTKTKMRVNENIVFVTKLFLKYQLAVDMWPTWRGRRHCYDHWLIRAAFLEWGVFSCVCEWVLQTVLWKNIQPQEMFVSAMPGWGSLI